MTERDTSPPTVFWSWQSDISPKACRAFIRSALVKAVKTVGEELGLEDAARPELDYATKGEAGMVDISEAIFRKIGGSAVFVADLTPIGQTKDRKALPNPNVLVELGWALHRPGVRRVIGVLNESCGYSVTDLPFDIRQKRILTYRLSEDADETTRAAAREELTSDLTAALRTNLGEHLDDAAAVADATGVAARDGEPSIWASATDPLIHQDASGGPTPRKVAVPGGPRGYIRLIPAGWKNDPPAIHDIATLSDDAAVWPPYGGAAVHSGDLGGIEDGFARYWVTGHDDNGERSTTNIVVYFEETGEFWALHGTAVGKEGGRHVLKTERLLEAWSMVMRSSLAVFDQFEATPVRRVEVGLTGIAGVQWQGLGDEASPPARKSTLKHSRQDRDWSHDAQIDYLTGAYNKLRNLFGLPHATDGAVQGILG